MSVFKFTRPDGKIFELQGPANATFDQAKAIFDKQLASGGLTGIPVGGVVNAVTQAAGGLSSALAQIGPQAAALTKQIGGAINLPTKLGALIPNAISVSNFVNTKITRNRRSDQTGSGQIQGDPKQSHKLDRQVWRCESRFSAEQHWITNSCAAGIDEHKF